MELVLNVKKRSVSCWCAKAFLARKGYHAKVVHTTNEELGELLKHFAR
jgi:hypothetical protein